MKNRIYKIKDKILVQGDENKLTEDEILVKEENGSVVLKERVNGEVKSIAGGSELSGSNLSFLDIRGAYDIFNLMDLRNDFISLLTLVKYNGNNSDCPTSVDTPMSFYSNTSISIEDIDAIAISFNTKVMDPQGTVYTIEQLLRNYHFESMSVYDFLNSLPTMTENEFYSL